MTDIEHVAAVQNEAGESPHWSADEQALYWADIVDPHLCRYCPDTGELEVRPIDVPVTGLGLRSSGGFVMAARNGLHLWEADGITHTFVADPEEDRPVVRFNDGLVDPQGRYWAGSLDETDLEAPDGVLYRLDPDLTLHTIETGLRWPNGIGWSPDHQTMYVVDSAAQVVYAYAFDLLGGFIADRRVFAEIPKEAGMPDGLTVDSEGGVWLGHWGGWTLTRYDPAGRIEREIRLPTQNVTSCIFGGTGLDELYITTAWYLLSDDERAQQPTAGDLFRIRPGVKGLPDPPFAG
jgi:sugar lactone lactonase YvrE